MFFFSKWSDDQKLKQNQKQYHIIVFIRWFMFSFFWRCFCWMNFENVRSKILSWKFTEDSIRNQTLLNHTMQISFVDNCPITFTVRKISSSITILNSEKRIRTISHYYSYCNWFKKKKNKKKRTMSKTL